MQVFIKRLSGLGKVFGRMGINCHHFTVVTIHSASILNTCGQALQKTTCKMRWPEAGDHEKAHVLLVVMGIDYRWQTLTGIKDTSAVESVTPNSHVKAGLIRGCSDGCSIHDVRRRRSLVRWCLLRAWFDLRVPGVYGTRLGLARHHPCNTGPNGARLDAAVWGGGRYTYRPNDKRIDIFISE